jgi:hypothetical protein
VRYYLGVDWADQTHAVWVVDERGTKVALRTVPHTAAGLSEWGRELDRTRRLGDEGWAHTHLAHKAEHAVDLD